MSKSLSTSFYLSPEIKAMLKVLAEAEKRSQANMLEVLIETEFKKQNLKLPKK